MKKLSELFAAAAGEEIIIPTTWGQGRATLGGLVGAVLYAKLAHHINTQDKMLRSASISFVAPVAPTLATLTCEVFREGKSVVQAQSKLIQNGEVKATMLASFGSERESAISLTAVDAPSFSNEKPPEQAMKFPYVAGMMPEFFQHIDMRLATGNLPYTGASTPDFAGYMRFSETWQDDALELAHLITLIDAWPPSVLPLFTKSNPASSLSWTFELIKPLSSETMQTLWQYQVSTDYAADGYTHSRANIWNDTGELIAISRQTVTVFA